MLFTAFFFTLQWKSTFSVDKICKLYETAVKLDPTNEELHTHLFMSYVHVFDFKSQQKSAMTLYKLKPKNPYYCWAVMSIILQATRGDGRADPKKRALLLSLAERMMDKLITDNKLEAEQEVQLYIMILELLGKYEEILNALDVPLGMKLTTVIPSTDRLTYLVKLGKWSDVNLLCKGLLLERCVLHVCLQLLESNDSWVARFSCICNLYVICLLLSFVSLQLKLCLLMQQKPQNKVSWNDF